MVIEAMLSTVISSVISGIIGNKADRIAINTMEIIANNFFNKGNREDNQSLQKAVLRSYYHALKDICEECLLKEKGNKRIRPWLECELEDANFAIKSIEKNEYSFLPIEKIDQIKLLLATDSIAENQVENERQKLIAFALERDGTPLCYTELVKSSLFEKVCNHFEYEIKHNKEVSSIFQSKLLSNVDIKITDLSESFEKHMDVLHENNSYISMQINELKKLMNDYILHNGSTYHGKLSEEACAEIDQIADSPLNGIEGIITKQELRCDRKLPGEVFAIELLTEDIFLARKEDKIKVEIDRRNTNHVVITSTGKNNLNKKIILEGNMEGTLRKRDLEIHSYLNRTAESADDLEKISLKELGIYLRWASGGILPIVEYKARKYVPFLYRDKEPFGWNLFLGSSERQFDANGKLIKEVESEYNNPSRFISREFEEELLVFETEPNAARKVNKIIPISMPFRNDNNIAKFCEKHLLLRKRYDDLNIAEDDEKSINCDLISTRMELRIVDAEGRGLKPFSNLLVCFNLLELGIEVVQVVKFKLEDHNVLLDGEILSMDDDELVRMPIALISCDFLQKKFGGNLSNTTYTSGVNPSIVIDEPIPRNEMVLFQYDLKERLKVVNKSKSKVGPLEEGRYIASFEKYFDRHTYTVKEGYTKFFTPTAAKMLNLMFAQVDPKEYR